MISVEDISVAFGSFELLSNVSFLVNPRDRIGLTGKNGAGKTTLLKIIYQTLQPTSGRITIPSGTRTGFLPQQLTVSDTTTVMNETLKAFSKLNIITEKISLTSNELSKRSDWESGSYIAACDRLAELEDELRISGGDSYIAETEQALTGLGFERAGFNRPTAELSGGWRMRIELAKILLMKPDLLLLDEPTNHLDIESIQWFESFLNNYPGAVILVSHDRAFLDNITKRTIELSLGKAYDYRVSYSRYLVLRRERGEQQLAAFRNQKKMISDTEKFIERFRYKNTKAVQVQSRIKKLNKLERIVVDEEDSSAIKIKFSPAPRSGTIVIETEELSKSFDQLVVLDSINFIIERGEKVAFVGRNGEGKTTFSRIIAGDLDHTGSLKRGHNLKIGYYAQNQDELLDETLTLFQTIDNIATGEIRTRIRDLLGAFLFGGGDIDKKVRVLSGGERSRLALIKLLLEPYNLLVLDEPTNHLDMRSKEILKQALVNYDGTLIVVSHDRDFLDGLVGKVYEFRNNNAKENIGGIYDFLHKKRIENLRDIEKKTKEVHKKDPRGITSSKKQYLKKKEHEKKIRKQRNLLNDTESEIERIERSKFMMEKAMSSQGNHELLDKSIFYSEYENLKKALEDKMKEWENISNNIEELKDHLPE